MCPASQLDGVTELLGGGLAGQMLLLAWLFGMPLWGMHVRLPALSA